MILQHIKGNTYYLSGNPVIPLYMVSNNQCVLLDSGDLIQREDILSALSEYGIQPIGILGTHTHTDHSPNHHYFRQQYHLPVALPAGEACIASNPLMQKAYFYTFTNSQLSENPVFSEMNITADVIIYPDTRQLTFCGTDFHILHTPGHSPDHISIVTPDNILYLGDALLTEEEMRSAKLPYFFSITDAIKTMKSLAATNYSIYIAAHNGICENIQDTVNTNIMVLENRAAHILQSIENGMTFDAIRKAVCGIFSLYSNNLDKCLVYERNIRTYIDYLIDTQQLHISAQKGELFYSKTTGTTEVSH